MVADSPPWDWRKAARCLANGCPTHVFYVEDWEEEEVKVAKAICEECPVKEQCLDFAMGTREKFGIWGGLTGNERRSLIRRMRKRGEEIPRYSLPAPRATPDY